MLVLALLLISLAGAESADVARAPGARRPPPQRPAPSKPVPEIRQGPQERRIQIGIFPKVDEVSMVFRGKYFVGDHELERGQRMRLEPAPTGLTLGKLSLPAEVTLIPAEPGASVEISDRRYGGSLKLRRDPSGETVTVIEEVGIETYLLGVVPYEMEPGWPIEALKSQAVVARTFAYTQFDKYRKDGFDLTADTRSQVYKGLAPTTETVRRAVLETRGEVLGYKGEILSVYYHACCGGHTANAKTVWGGDAPPPLWGVKDKFCYKSPLRRWTAFISHDELLAALSKSRLIGGALRRFEIGRIDAGGYVRSFNAKVGGESIQVRAGDLRSSIGADRLRSTHIQRLRRSRKGVEFVGAGSGHGVGLCQWGAKLQAQAGRRYETILAMYFPGSLLSVVDE